MTDPERHDSTTGPGQRDSDGERSFIIAGTRLDAPRLAPGLHIVATPIGNLRDVTLRALETLAAADLILCEDTRVSRKLLDHYGIAAKTQSYNDHNAQRVRPGLIARLADGAAIALISDAGTPLLSDPGFKLVADAVSENVAVSPVPGASALLAALVVSGLPSDSVHFAGFLPAKAGARRSRIADLAAIPATLVLYEAPQRLAATLGDLAEELGDRPATIARELTKRFEEARRGSLPDLADWAAATPVKGEIVIVIGPPRKAPTSADDIDRALADALAGMTVKDAASHVATAFGAPRREVYQRALALSASLRGDDADTPGR